MRPDNHLAMLQHAAVPGQLRVLCLVGLVHLLGGLRRRHAVCHAHNHAASGLWRHSLPAHDSAPALQHVRCQTLLLEIQLLTLVLAAVNRAQSAAFSLPGATGASALPLAAAVCNTPPTRSPRSANTVCSHVSSLLSAFLSSQAVLLAARQSCLGAATLSPARLTASSLPGRPGRPALRLAAAARKRPRSLS